MGFRFSRRWCSTGGGPRGRCPPSWAGTRFFLRGLRPPGFMQGHSPCTHPCRRSAPRPGKLCGAGSPCAHRCEEGLRPSRSKSLDLALRSSPWVGLPGPHPGFLSFHDERNQRRAGAAPLDPQCVIAALFALAALRFGSRRATFYHQPRPICHFEMGGRIGLFFSLGFCEGTPSGFRPWRGRWAN